MKAVKEYCGKYPKYEVLPDEDGRCSLCGSELTEEGECKFSLLDFIEKACRERKTIDPEQLINWIPRMLKERGIVFNEVDEQSIKSIRLIALLMHRQGQIDSMNSINKIIEKCVE